MKAEGIKYGGQGNGEHHYGVLEPFYTIMV